MPDPIVAPTTNTSTPSTPTTSNIPASSAPTGGNASATGLPIPSANQQAAPAPEQRNVEGKNLTDAPVEGAETKEVQPTAEQKWKLKVDGVEQELEQSEVIRRAQLATASQQRFEQASQIEKQAKQVTTLFHETPVEAMLHLHGPQKTRELMEQYLYEQLQYDQLSPEQKKYKETEKELQRYRDQEKQTQMQREQEQATELQKHYSENFKKRITEALQTSGLPDSDETRSRMAFYLQQAVRKGLGNDVPMELIVNQVRQDYQNTIQRLFQSADGPALLQLIGPETIQKIQQTHFDKVKSGQPLVPSRPLETPISQANPAQKKRGYISMDEARAEIAKKINS